MSGYIFPPATPPALPVKGEALTIPVRRVYCIGRNYADHAVEMGHDPSREAPFFFQKNPDSLDPSGEFPYPAQSEDVHHEVELAAVLGKGGQDIPEADALAHVWGFAVALDMTCRDLQAAQKKAGRPWEIGKAFERSAPVGLVHPAAEIGPMAEGRITLSVNGETRQAGDLAQMIWKLPEIVSYLSRFFVLAPGDVILTGTPAGVGPVAKGDVMQAEIAGLTPLTCRVI